MSGFVPTLDESMPDISVKMDSAEELAMVERLLVLVPDAVAENPRLVRFMAQTCLRYRHHDEEKASVRFKSYIEWRRKTFGDLADHSFEHDKLRSQILSNFFQISPVRLDNGAGLICITMKHHQPSVYSTEDTVRCVHYLIMNEIANDPLLAQKGFVFMNNMADIGLGHLDLNVPPAIIGAISHALPVRVCNMAVINPPFVVRAVIPIVKAILSSKMGQRLHVIPNGKDTSKQLLIPAEHLPEAAGGHIILNSSALINQLQSKRVIV